MSLLHPMLGRICRQIEENDIQELSLTMVSAWALSKEDWSVLSSALAHNTSIRSLELSIGIEDEHNSYIAFGFLEINQTIQSLRLATNSEFVLGFFLSSVGKISSSSSNYLQRVHLEWNSEHSPTSETLHHLYVALLPLQSIALQGIVPLTTINDTNTNNDAMTIPPPRWRDVTLQACDLSSSDSVKWFAKATSLQCLRIRHSQLSHASLQILGELPLDAAAAPPLVHLDLSHNDLNPEDCTYLSIWLDSLKHLQELLLNDNPQIGSLGLSHLCQTVCHTIRTLDVSHCQLTTHFGVVLDTFPFLQAINVSENPIPNLFRCLQDGGASELQEVVAESMMVCDDPTDVDTDGWNDVVLAEWIAGGAATTVKLLNLSGNRLSKNTLRSLAQFSSCDVLILAGCHLTDASLEILLLQGDDDDDDHDDNGNTPSWKELYLSSNQISNEGLGVLQKAFLSKKTKKKLRSLTHLSLEYNPLDPQKLQQMTSLPHSLQTLQVSSSSSSSSENKMMMMEHTLRLNRAGKSLLFANLPCSLWPWILSEANKVYGANAIYDFLRQRPDLLLAAQ